MFRDQFRAVDAKRALDLTLVLTTLPVYGAICGLSAAAVLLADGRPLFFEQTRIGKNRRPFRVYKLRTMTLEADERLRKPTCVGLLLRRHGWDELPQFWNVVRGDMSLVGPRPLSERDTERLVGEHPAFAERFRVLPGITGLAQVTGARGVAATTDADADYARRAGVRLDIAILVRTVWINFVGKERGKAEPHAYR